MKVRPSKRAIIIISIIAIAISVCGLAWYAHKQQIPEGYVRVKSYVYVQDGDIACAAFTPSCGECVDGKVINKQCYVPKGSAYDGQ